MNGQNFDINKLRIASPCSVPWDTMKGDDRRRFCNLCQLNVYNFSEMTEREVQKMIAEREGRICGRLYRRTDGTVLTKDCPVGWRAVQKRVARFAGAALTLVLGLFSVSFGQKEDKKAVDASKLNIVRTIAQESILSGVVTDPNGAVVPNAEITLRKGKTVVAVVRTNDNGEYSFSRLASGVFSLEANGAGFNPLTVKNIKISDNEKAQMDILLKIDGEVFVGILVENDSLIDPTKTGVTTTITQRQIERLPH